MPKRVAQEAKRTSAEVVDAYKVELAQRIAKAFKQFNADAPRGSEISQEGFANAVSDALRLTGVERYKQTAVSRWMSMTNPAAPPPPVLAAIAKVLNVDLMWLTYGAAED